MPGESAGTSRKCPNVARRVVVNGRSLTKSGRSEAKSLDDDEASHRIHRAMARAVVIPKTIRAGTWPARTATINGPWQEERRQRDRVRIDHPAKAFAD